MNAMSSSPAAGAQVDSALDIKYQRARNRCGNKGIEQFGDVAPIGRGDVGAVPNSKDNYSRVNDVRGSRTSAKNTRQTRHVLVERHDVAAPQHDGE